MPPENLRSAVSGSEDDRLSVLPPIDFSWRSKKLNIAIGWIVVLVFDLVGPLLMYYLLTDHTDLSEDAILGIALGALGLGEILEFPYRTYLLVRYRSEYGPLDDGNGKWWHFDVVWWFYIIATIVATIPFAVSSSVSPVQHEVYLMSFAILLGFCGVLGLLSLIPLKLPVRLSSDPAGSRMKPAGYYLTEDFVAVDAGQGKLFRRQFRDRYEHSNVFRSMIWHQTVFFSTLCLLYVALAAAVTWTLPFRKAFGLIFGLLFACIILGCCLSYLSCKWWLRREYRETKA